MPVIIDMDCMLAVFVPTCKEHNDFKPVNTWIRTGVGRMVIGGTTYRKQLSRMPRIVKLVSELAKDGKVITLTDAEVDTEEARVAGICSNADFDVH